MLESPELLARAEGLFPFIGRLPPELLDQLRRQGLAASIPRGHPVCREGAQCTHLALVLSGSARVFKIGESGRDITLYRVEAGQSCILTASCILSGIPFPAVAECEEPAEAILLPSARVRDWCGRSEAFRDYLFGVLAQRLSTLIPTVEDVAFRRLDQRLAGYLLERGQGGATLRATHQEIASDLGSSREAVSRLLKDFEGRGMLRTGRALVEIVDQKALAGLQREAAG